MQPERDRATWLKQQRRWLMEQEDTIYAPIYDENWGAIDSTHQEFLAQLLDLCPPGGRILDAACGTGKYWPMILESGRNLLGIDQSQGMLAQALEKFPHVPVEKVGLQEMDYREAFDGALCIDALEMVAPEDWPLVLSNLNRALKSSGHLYFTVELAEAQDIEKAFIEGRQAGLPVVFGEWAQEGGYHDVWAQDGFYHFYPAIEQVKDWLDQAGFRLNREMVGDIYHHFLASKR
jgi:ubiquinone/menaquinone biosynthesis C-methylase UbiE